MSIYFRPDNTAYVPDTNKAPNPNPTGLLGDEVTSISSEPDHVYACQALAMSAPRAQASAGVRLFNAKPLKETITSMSIRLARMGKDYYEGLLKPEQWTALNAFRTELRKIPPFDRSAGQRQLLLGMDCLVYAKDTGSCIEGAKIIGLNPEPYEQAILKILDSMFNIKLDQLCDPTHEAQEERDETNPISRILTHRQWMYIEQRRKELERIQVKTLPDMQMYEAINNLLCVKECGSYQLAAIQLNTSKYHLALSITTRIFNGMFDLNMPRPKE